MKKRTIFFGMFIFIFFLLVGSTLALMMPLSEEKMEEAEFVVVGEVINVEHIDSAKYSDNFVATIKVDKIRKGFNAEKEKDDNSLLSVVDLNNLDGELEKFQKDGFVKIRFGRIKPFDMIMGTSDADYVKGEVIEAYITKAYALHDKNYDDYRTYHFMYGKETIKKASSFNYFLASGMLIYLGIGVFVLLIIILGILFLIKKLRK